LRIASRMAVIGRQKFVFSLICHPAMYASAPAIFINATGRVTTVAELCAREKCSVRQVNMTISLAFLAPNLIKAAVEGRLPRGIGIERLRDPPTEWSGQFEALGLNPE